MKLKQVDWMHANDNNYSNTPYNTNPTHTQFGQCEAAWHPWEIGHITHTHTVIRVQCRTWLKASFVLLLMAFIRIWWNGRHNTLNILNFWGEKVQLARLISIMMCKRKHFRIITKNVTGTMKNISTWMETLIHTLIRIYASNDSSGHYTAIFVAINILGNLFASNDVLTTIGEN